MFSTRRGRPRSKQTSRDKGTPELQAKRKYQLTTDPLDICLERNLITPDQHRAGIRLRWLYAKRFGAPSIATSDPGFLGGKNLRKEHPIWQAATEKEYHNAMEALERIRTKTVTANVCIFSIHPLFLTERPITERAINQLHSFQTGLAELVRMWRGETVDFPKATM